jgi:hypothetical protein
MQVQLERPEQTVNLGRPERKGLQALLDPKVTLRKLHNPPIQVHMMRLRRGSLGCVHLPQVFLDSPERTARMGRTVLRALLDPLVL